MTRSGGRGSRTIPSTFLRRSLSFCVVRFIDRALGRGGSGRCLAKWARRLGFVSFQRFFPPVHVGLDDFLFDAQVAASIPREKDMVMGRTDDAVRGEVHLVLLAHSRALADQMADLFIGKIAGVLIWKIRRFVKACSRPWCLLFGPWSARFVGVTGNRPLIFRISFLGIGLSRLL